MNRESLQYSNHDDANLEIPALAQKGFFTVFIDKLSAMLVRREMERSRAHFRARRAHEERTAHSQDIIRSLPIEELLRLRMYPFMD
jgi:hypothetical protein